MALKKPRVLYFTRNSKPTAEEIAEAETYAFGNVGFRAACFADGSPEPCDYVAGTIPPEYKKVPHADKYKAPVKTPATRGTDDAKSAKAETKAEADKAKADAKASAKGDDNSLWAKP